MCGNLVELTHFGHIILLSWGTISNVPNLQLGLIGLLPQKGRCLCLIFDNILISLNDAVKHQASPLVIQFGDTLRRLLTLIFISYTAYGLVLLEMVYLSDTYMPVCIFLEVIPQLVFIVLKHLSYLKHMIVFNPFLPVWYMHSTQCFHANPNQSLSLSPVVTMYTTPNPAKNGVVSSEEDMTPVAVMAKLLFPQPKQYFELVTYKHPPNLNSP